jgi:recombination protein RecA
LIDLGVDQGVVEKSGTWISFGGERLGQGRENARVFLKEHSDVREKLENTLRKKMGIPLPGAANGTPDPAAQPEKHAVQAAAVATSGGKARPTR